MTRDLDHLPKRDVERLSAYLDGELSDRGRVRLEARLREEERLQRGLKELTGAVKIMRRLPQVPPPRNFTLTPEMAGKRQVSWGYPALQFATALAAALLVAVVVFDAFGPSLVPMAGAPAAPAERAEAPLAMEAQPTQAPPGEPELEERAAVEPTAAAPQSEAGMAEAEGDQAPQASPTSSPVAGEQAFAGEPPAEQAEPPGPEPSDLQAESEPEPPAAPLDGLGQLRIVEIGLAVLVLALLVLTLRLRPEWR